MHVHVLELQAGEPRDQRLLSALERLRVVSIFFQIMAFFRNAVNVVGDVVGNAVVKRCTFVNDTKYKVAIVDHDGTRNLHPGQSQGNYLVAGFSVDLVMKLSDTKEVKINFPSSRFENRTHKMGLLFENDIREFERSRAVNSMSVLSGSSRWHLAHGHPGGFEEKATIKMVSKNSWKNEQEKGVEAEAKVGAMIKAVELSASFKAHTKLTRVDEHEAETTSIRERTFKEPCYLWQEIVVIKTNQAAPFDELQIPTKNIVKTLTAAEPGKEKLLYSK